MGKFIKGDVVVIPFPFSDLSGSKRRPAFVLTDLPGDDILLCQVTSQQTKDSFSITVVQSDFVRGSLPVDSFIRPQKIFTANKKLIVRKAGTISSDVYVKVSREIIKLLQ